MKKIIILLLLVCLPALHHGEVRHYRHLHARDVGLGLSNVTDATWTSHPAGLAVQEKSQLLLSQARLGFDRYAYQIAGVMPLGIGAIGLGFDQLIIQNERYRRLLFDGQGQPVIDPLTNEQAFEWDFELRLDSVWQLAYAVNLWEQVSLGLGGEAVHIKVGENYAWGFDGRIGLTMGLTDRLAVAVLINYLNQQWLAWRVPYQVQTGQRQVWAGLAYHWPLLAAKFHLAYEQAGHDSNHAKIRAGVEHLGLAPLALRLGWAADQFNFGIGIKWDRIELHYALVTDAEFDAANRVTLQLFF